MLNTLTVETPYRRRLSVYEAIMMMRDRMEGQFDLEILRALIHALGPRDAAAPGGRPLPGPTPVGYNRRLAQTSRPVRPEGKETPILTATRSRFIAPVAAALIGLLLGLAFLLPGLSAATAQYSLATQWGRTGSGDDQFLRIGGIDVDAGGNVYAVDTVSGRIQ